MKLFVFVLSLFAIMAAVLGQERFRRKLDERPPNTYRLEDATPFY
ncbi:unnamed protein product [Plutella xylostella]|uniref:(diamondback moth) hypothetical protein n=1 Tax=Plutella xylostella TaxID=51655 RepID=A0A8S4GD71_PLUXY|nr:unnamed protein product [Plutella xylostella]